MTNKGSSFDILYKYVKPKYVEGMVKKGEFRIGTYYDYRDGEKHGVEIHDAGEGTLIVVSKDNPEDWLIPERRNFLHRMNHPGNIPGVEFSDNTFIKGLSIQDAFMFCMSSTPESPTLLYMTSEEENKIRRTRGTGKKGITEVERIRELTERVKEHTRSPEYGTRFEDYNTILENQEKFRTQSLAFNIKRVEDKNVVVRIDNTDGQFINALTEAMCAMYGIEDWKIDAITYTPRLCPPEIAKYAPIFFIKPREPYNPDEEVRMVWRTKQTPIIPVILKCPDATKYLTVIP